MNRAALNEAKRSLDRAMSAFAAMKKAATFDEFFFAWSDFLVLANRVYSKLEQGAKNSGSAAWFGQKRRERRDDPLLSYVHHARNVDEHGIGPGSTQPFPKFGKPNIERVAEIGDEGINVKHVVMRKILHDQADLPASYLLPVRDRGVTYQPPTHHRDLPIPDPTTLGVAQLTLDSLVDIVTEAEKLVI